MAVFGRECNPSGKPRSASTSVNRIEFPDYSSTLKPVQETATPSTMVWDDGAYTGYKLNCHKKKRKVESLIELYDKDSVNSVQDEKIFLVKLGEISTAALEAVEYMNEILAELEISEEEERIAEIKRIKKIVTDSVKKNEKEVKAEMQRILTEAAQAEPPPIAQTAALTASDLQQALAGLNLGAAGLSAAKAAPRAGPDIVSKLTLRHGHILEDADDFQKVISAVKLAADMTDSEVIFFMRKSEPWTKKIDDLVSSDRKFQEEALGTLHRWLSNLIRI